MSDDADLQLFKFHDGQRERAVDPMRVALKLQAKKFVELAGKLTQGDAEGSLEAIDAAREVFGLEPVKEDGSGVPDLRVAKIVKQFFEWQETLKNAVGSVVT